MRRTLLMSLGVAAAALLAACAGTHAQSNAWLDQYKPIAQKIIAQSQSSDFAWKRLAELTDTFGNRLSGSETLEQAIDWAVAAMKADGLENVRKERVMVPKWVRGRESLELVQPVKQPLVMLGLGDSVGTPAAGIEADVLIVKNFEISIATPRTSRARSCSSTCRSRTTGRSARIDPTVRRARPSSARSRRSCDPSARKACERPTREDSSIRPMRQRFPPRRSLPKTPIAFSA